MRPLWHSGVVMRCQSRHPIVVLLLAALVAIGLSLTAVQASAMAGMGGMSAHAACTQCGEDSDGMPSGNVWTCVVPACTVPAAIVASSLPAMTLAATERVVLKDEAMPSGRAFAPDLRPPRLPAIG